MDNNESLYELLDKLHIEDIQELGADQHLVCINEYKEASKLLNKLIADFEENKRYDQATIFSTFLRTIAHKITNHYDVLGKEVSPTE